MNKKEEYKTFEVKGFKNNEWHYLQLCTEKSYNDAYNKMREKYPDYDINVFIF